MIPIPVYWTDNHHDIINNGTEHANMVLNEGTPITVMGNSVEVTSPIQSTEHANMVLNEGTPITVAGNSVEVTSPIQSISEYLPQNVEPISTKIVANRISEYL
jgi:hypothetical protein